LGVAAPLALRDVVVEMDPNALVCELGSNGIENLQVISYMRM
jgi:hypothetical protein